MPLPYHLVDGYNLLHAAGLARATYGPGDLERARYGLLVRVADGLGDAERERTTVVFDAADPPPGAERRFRFRELTVLFAVETGEADALIEELIRRHSSPRQLRVVSDDIRLQQAAKRRGAQAVKSDSFLRRLARYAGQPRRATEVAPTASGPDDEGEDWVRFFGLKGDDVRREIDDLPSVAARRSAGPLVPRSERESAPSAPRRKNAAGKAGKPRPQGTDPVAEPESEAPAEDLAFWQRRIDEMVSDEGKTGRRPETS